MKARQVHTNGAVYNVREVAGMIVVTCVSGKQAGSVFKGHVQLLELEVGKPFVFSCTDGKQLTIAKVSLIEEA